MHTVPHALWRCNRQLAALAVVGATSDNRDTAIKSTAPTTSTAKATAKHSAVAAAISLPKRASSGCAILATTSWRHGPKSTATPS